MDISVYNIVTTTADTRRASTLKEWARAESAGWLNVIDPTVDTHSQPDLGDLLEAVTLWRPDYDTRFKPYEVLCAAHGCSRAYAEELANVTDHAKQEALEEALTRLEAEFAEQILIIGRRLVERGYITNKENI